MAHQQTSERMKTGLSPEGKLWVRFAVFMFVMVGATFGVYWYFAVRTYHLAEVQPGVLYRDGNRDLREFKHALTFTGAKTVVSLVDDRERDDPAKPQFRQEMDWCVSHEVQYIRIPVQLGGWPSSDDLKSFISVVTNPANQPVLVHCAQGVRRTGMFVAAYQESVLHESPAHVKGEILKFGHRDSDLEDVRKFVDVYSAASIGVPTSMPVGKE